MRTNISTLVTLNTIICNPFRDCNCDTAFFVSSCTCWESSIFSSYESTYRKIITFLCIDRFNNIFNKIRNISIVSFRLNFDIFPFSRYSNFLDFTTTINRIFIHINDIFAFSTKRLNNSFLHFINCIIVRNYVCNFKESRLHNSICSITQTNFVSNFCSINDINFNFLFS